MGDGQIPSVELYRRFFPETTEAEAREFVQAHLH
jgi:hypothetical protein